MNNQVTIGSRWQASDHTEFTVLQRVELEGNIWIHYRDQHAKEYSCFEEAFVSRFNKIVN